LIHTAPVISIPSWNITVDNYEQNNLQCYWNFNSTFGQLMTSEDTGGWGWSRCFVPIIKGSRNDWIIAQT